MSKKQAKPSSKIGKNQQQPQKARQALNRQAYPVQRVQSVGSAMSRPLRQFSPQEKTGRNGSRTIHYKEFVQDIAGSVAFSAIQFACNPGLSNLFAWLSGQALFYQEFTVKSLRFTFETEKATSLSGKVMFAFLQDSSDPVPASKQEMLENLIKAAGAIWQAFDLNVNMGNFPALGKSRFVRSGALAANLDVKTYDIGQLIVATQGMADSSAAGELYVEYDIELRTPLQSAAQMALAYSGEITGVTPSQTSLFGTTPTLTGGLDMTASGNTVTFNKVGQYSLFGAVGGTGLFTTFTPVYSGTATTVHKQGISNAAANAGTIALFESQITVTARGQTCITDVSTVAATITGSSARVGIFPTSLA